MPSHILLLLLKTGLFGGERVFLGGISNVCKERVYRYVEK